MCVVYVGVFVYVHGLSGGDVDVREGGGAPRGTLVGTRGRTQREDLGVRNTGGLSMEEPKGGNQEGNPGVETTGGTLGGKSPRR